MFIPECKGTLVRSVEHHYDRYKRRIPIIIQDNYGYDNYPTYWHLQVGIRLFKALNMGKGLKNTAQAVYSLIKPTLIAHVRYILSVYPTILKRKLSHLYL